MNEPTVSAPPRSAPGLSAARRESDWRLRVLAITRRSWVDPLATGRDGPSSGLPAAVGQRPQAGPAPRPAAR